MSPRVPFFQRLSVRLAGMILLAGLVIVPLVSEFSRRAAEQIVLQQAELQATTATLAVVEGLQNVLRSAEATVRLLSQDLENRTMTAAEVDRMVRNALASNPTLSECGIAYEARALSPDIERLGRQIFRSDGHLVAMDLATAEYAYWTHDWYADAVLHGGLTWTEPAYDRGTEARIVRVAAPFYREQGGQRVVAGVVMVGLTLDWVRQLTMENEFFDSGYVIIFSRAGRLISHPDPKRVLVQTMESLAGQSGNPELGQIYQRVASNRQGSLSYRSNSLHQRVHENYKPVSIAGWGVVVGYEEKEFLRQVNAFRWITMASLASLLFLLLVIVVVSIRMALRPLERLTEVSFAISQGNLDSPIAVAHRRDEIGHLSRSFVLMQDTLKRNRELEAKVQERTREVAAANDQLNAEILERRWVNQSLEHQVRYSELIINSFSDPLLVCTKALNISRANSAAVRLTGWQTAEMIDVPLGRFLRLKSDEGLPPAARLGRLTQALKDGHELRDEAATVTDKTGTSLHVRLTLSPIRDRDKVVGGVVVLQAIATDRSPSPA